MYWLARREEEKLGEALQSPLITDKRVAGRRLT